MKALASDVSGKLDSFGRRLEALESQSGGTGGAESSSNTSTPAPEALRSDCLAPSHEGSTPCREGLTPCHGGPTPWADRSVNEVPNYDKVLVWPEDDEEASSSKIFAVSEKVLRESFLEGIPAPSRKQLRERFGDPKCPPMQVPRVDKIVTDRVSQEKIKLDKALARLQAMFLDAVGPSAT